MADTSDPHTDHGLIHALYDAAKGLLSPSAPPKPAYSSAPANVPLGNGLAQKGASNLGNRGIQVDKAVEDAGG